MVDKVNLNPFTLQDFTVEQLEELDADKDGVVSDSEVKAKWSWLSEHSQDNDSMIVSSSPAALPSEYEGVKDSASTPEEFKEYMTIVADEYLEKYMSAHTKISDSERALVQDLISSFVNEYTMTAASAKDSAPYDMKTAIAEFQTKMDKILSDNEESLKKVNASIESYQDNAEGNLETLMNLSAGAIANKNVSNSEWNQIKNKALQYLMGAMLSGDVDSTLLGNINKNYAKDSNYKSAMTAINELQSCSDPVKCQQLMTTAQNSITEFFESAGKDKTVNAVESYSQGRMEEAMGTALDDIADAYIEANTTAGMSEDDKAEMKELVDNCKNKFMSKLAESGTIAEYGQEDLKAQFTDFINTQKAALDKAQESLDKSATEIEEAYNNLVKVSDAANANGNISNDEKSTIVNAAKTLIMDQLLNGLEEIPFLQGLDSSYKTNPDYKKVLDLVSKMRTEIDADKIAEYQKEADGLLTKMLDSYDGNKLITAVNTTKPIEVTDASKQKIIYNSSISSEYQANASRSTSRGKQNDDRLNEIQDMAKADLNSVAESLKAQLKSELGDAYDEAAVQRYINDAMNDTIAVFTQNVSRRNGHGNYNTGADEQAFVFLRRSGTSKGRYVYNVQSLVNTFISKFNETSKEKQAARIDPSKATYDKENVIADSLGNDYYRNKTETVYGKNNDNNAYAELIEKAKSQLRILAASLKSSLIAEGVPISTTEIDKIVDECLNATIEDMKSAFQYCQPGGKVSGGGIASMTLGTGAVTGATVAAVAAAGEVSAAVASGAAGSFGLAGATVAIPIVGWAVGALAITGGALAQFTNFFGATYGKHNSGAGFFFERKSNSHSGNWGYDTQTLVNLFLSKVDEKVAEAKEKKKNPEKTEETEKTN